MDRDEDRKPMSAPEPPPTLDAATVRVLARLAGYPPLSPETATRIAVGATNAVRAVAATVDRSLFDAAPESYLAELERLADEG
jgi:hypothetical protein